MTTAAVPGTAKRFTPVACHTDMLQLTDEQQAFVESMRDFAARECGTREQRDAHAEGHDPEIYRRIAELGWVGASIPEAYGGGGGGAVDVCLLLEETTRGLLPIGAMAVSLIVAGAVERFGTEEQKHEILGSIAAGNPHAIAMSEPEAGSDVGSLQCRAERRNGSYVINGQNTWITGAHFASIILLVCRSSREESKHQGISMVMVPTDAEGVEVRGIETMGGREVNDVFFADCVVPAEALL